jgi:hypothetical protein
MNVVLQLPAPLPYAGVGLAPVFTDEVRPALDGIPQVAREPLPSLELPGRVDDPSIDVELVLPTGRVPDAYREAPEIPGDVSALLLTDAGSSLEVVEDLDPRGG